MCGITGIYYFDKQRTVNFSQLKKMTDIIEHRGPDDEGHYIDKNVGLGHRRLSIIDLTPDGHQPMCNEDASIWIIFNGEFYNYLDYKDEIIRKGHQLRSRSDTEYMLHLYEDYGFDMVHKINGMFAFVIWDSKKQILFAARDRMGVKPFNYYIDNEKFLWGSEIKSILEHENVDKTIDNLALSDYFSFMSIPAPKTIYKKIRKLEPGHRLIISGTDIKNEKYWDLKAETNNYKSDGYYLDKFESLFADAVNLRMISDVPLGAFLSGGVDSSAVVAMMAKNGVKDIKTFSIAFKDQQKFDESIYAKQVAEQFQTHHTEFNLSGKYIDILPKLAWHFDEPFAVSSAFAVYYLSKMTREHVTVALSGDGGDELFAGYPFRYTHDTRFDSIEKIPMPLRKFILWTTSLTALKGENSFALKSRKARDYFKMAIKNRDDAFIDNFSYFDATLKGNLFNENIWGELSNYDSNSVYKKYYSEQIKGSRLFKRQLGDIKTSLPDEMLKKVDNMSMAVSIESRTPFLDYRLAEFSTQLPDHLKLNGMNGKVIVKKTMEKYLSNDILYRKKHGFNVPFGEWVKNELKDYINEILSEKNIKDSGIFNYSYICKIIELHRSGKYDYSNQIYMILMFEIWRKTFNS
jgi:asparagine synthase (glutamine-hydrolysing)